MRRLSIIVGVFFFISLILTVIVLLVAKARLDSDMKSLVEAQSFEVNAQRLKILATESVQHVLTMRAFDADILLFPDKMADLAPDKTAAYDANQAAYKDMRKLTQIQGTRDLIDRLDSMAEQQIQPADTRVLESIDSAPKTSKSIYNKDYEPLLIQYETMTKELAAVAQSEADAAQKQADAAQLRLQQSMTLVVIAAPCLVALCMVVLLPTLAVLVGRMTQRLDRTVEVLELAAGGDLSRRLDQGGTDELSRMCVAFNHAFDITSGAIKSMQESGIAIAGAATQLSATVKEQEVRATEQTASTVEVSATAQEIAATTRTLLQSMEDVSRIAETTASLASSGRERLSQMEQMTQQMLGAASPIVSQLAVLSEKAGNITAVVTTINKVADQTNLLSLNAAIEAEKAGEAGRGFGVVASEIRRLADQTAVSTLDIESIVKEVQTSVGVGVMRMDKFTEELRRATHDVRTSATELGGIIEQVQELTRRFEHVNDGVRTQVSAAEQISDAMRELRVVSEQNTEAVAQSNAVAEKLKEAANHLHRGVSKFKVQSDISRQPIFDT